MRPFGGANQIPDIYVSVKTLDMKCLFYLCLVLSVISACKESPEFQFEKDGVSFTCPAGWSIGEEEDFEGMGHYLAIEKNGLDPSGIVTISWINDSLDLTEWYETFIEGMAEEPVYANSNIKFPPGKPGKFNNIHTMTGSFQGEILGLKHEGSIHVFYAGDKTFAIMKQGAIPDREDNAPGFKTIESSFSFSSEGAAKKASPKDL